VDLTRQQRDLHRGLGDTLARSFEFAASLAIFTVVGYLVDRWLGTVPWFTIALAMFALTGQFVRFWYAYDADMRREQSRFEERREEGRHR